MGQGSLNVFLKGDISLKKNRIKYYIEKDGIFCHGTIIFLALSCVFCLIGSIGKWDDEFFIISQVALPVVCSLVFILFLILLGRKLLWLTCLPAVFMLAFFVIKSSEYNSLTYTIISIALSVISVFLYSAVSIGWLRKKWLLILTLTVGFFYHLYVKDYRTLMLLDPDNSISFSGVMQEISLLFMILAVLSAAFAMKNKVSIEEMNLPKMKKPKVIVNKDARNAETAETHTEEKECLPVEKEAKALPAENAAESADGSISDKSVVDKTAGNLSVSEEISEALNDGGSAAAETSESTANKDAQASSGEAAEKAVSSDSKDDTGAAL